MTIVHLVHFSFFSCKCHQRKDGRILALIAIQYCHYSVCFIYFKYTSVVNNFVSNFMFFILFCRIGFRSVDLFGGFILKFLLWIRQLLFQDLQQLNYLSSTTQESFCRSKTFMSTNKTSFCCMDYVLTNSKIVTRKWT